ncbi:tetratricopeptide repeat protein [Flavobacterium endophyticum]|uniref:Tetratricopeptide repeat protein n=1 Tax=Flavobacterium endophyticum TaxID=1540163 RepID=A0A495M776_9FLAO|nr:hypothetical protein [Flavobacterium endophyticum]RKS21926.1 tetratricopeptide repeat protein [Flavobacterium endophyticum]
MEHYFYKKVVKARNKKADINLSTIYYFSLFSQINKIQPAIPNHFPIFETLKQNLLKRFFLILLLFPMVVFSQSEYAKGEQFFKRGEYEKAKEIFLAIYQKKPKDLGVIEYLGDIDGHAKKWDGAFGYYEKLVELKPSEANYHYKYGGALAMKAKESSKFKALGMIDDVEDAFKKAIELNPKHIEARWALVELYLQLPGIIGGSERKAQKYADELMVLSTVDGYLSKGHIAEYFKRYKEAEKYYKKAVETGGSKTTYKKLADLYKNKMKQPEKAKAVLDEYTEKSKT